METARTGTRVYGMFAIVVLTCALGSLTQTVMNSMLGGITESFGTDDAVSQWLTTAFMLTIGVTVPLVTHLSRKTSIRVLVFWALGLFMLGTAIDYYAFDFLMLLAGRIPQAVATGMTLPILQAISMTRFPRERTGTAMGIAGIAMGFAPNIGPLIGGALVDSLGWRSFFAILFVALIILAVCAIILIPKEPSEDRGASLDWISFALSTIGFGGLLLGFTDAASMPLMDPQVIVPLLLGAACLILFVRRQRTVANPLIDLGVFSSRDYTVSFIAQNCLFASFMGITLIIPLFVQNVNSLSPLDAGIVFIPATILAAIVNPLAGILSDRIGVRSVVVTAALFLSMGSMLFVFIDADTPLWLTTLMQTIRGIGVSALIGPLNSWGMKKLPNRLMMDASVFSTTVRQACASFGTALMMVAITMGADLGLEAVVGYRIAFGISAVLALGVLILAVARVRQTP